MIYTISILLLFLLILFMLPELINNTKELMNTVPEITNKYQNIFNNFMTFIKTSNWPPEVKNAYLMKLIMGLNRLRSLL